MTMQREAHLKASDLLGMCQVRMGDFGKYAIVPGPLERMQAVLKNIENPVKNFSFYEYNMYTGNLGGIKVTVGNGGRFSPDTAINTELLCAGGTEYIIRTGSCGALREDIEIGDIIIASDAIRGEGVTPYYVDKDFKAQANPEVIEAFKKAAQKFGVKYHLGCVWTTDALLRETKEIVNKYIQQGAIAVDMVSSVVLTLAQFYGKKAGAVLVVSDNLITGKVGFTDLRYYEAEHKIIQMSLEAVKILEGK